MSTVESSPALHIEEDDGVLRLIKSNPREFYGMSLSMMRELTAALERVEKDKSIRAVIIDAEKEVLQWGAILVSELHPDMSTMTSADVRDIVQLGRQLGRKFRSLQVPVIAIARGGALGGGLEMFLQSDFAYCLDSAKFSFPEVTLGLIAAWGGTQWGSRFMPFRKAQEFLLLGEEIDGRTAEQWGLVTRSFPDSGALDAHVDAVLKRLRVCSPASFRWTKACLWARWEGPLSHGENTEMEAGIEATASMDCLKAIEAAGKRCKYDFVSKKIVKEKV